MTDAKMMPMTSIDVALPVPAQEEEYEMHQIAVARGEVFINQVLTRAAAAVNYCFCYSFQRRRPHTLVAATIVTTKIIYRY